MRDKTKPIIQIDYNGTLVLQIPATGIPEYWVGTDEEGVYTCTLETCPHRRFSYGVKKGVVAVKIHCIQPEIICECSGEVCKACTLSKDVRPPTPVRVKTEGDTTVRVGLVVNDTGDRGNETPWMSGSRTQPEEEGQTKVRTRKMPKLSTEAWDLAKSVATFIAHPYFTQKDEYERRIAVCDKCDHREVSRCTKCGCFVAIKARVKAWHCPENLWESKDERAE
jgi:hypothetical protein